MVPPKTRPEAVLLPIPSFQTARTDAHDDIPMLTLGVALNEKHTTTPAGLLTAVRNEGPVEFRIDLRELPH